jgi:hypothetical protein
LYRDSASPAASDTLGEIEFNGEDSAGNKQAYGLIHASILSPTSTAEQGQIHFETATAGALTEKMIIGTSNLVINEIGAVFNVRIEGDTDANLFYTDATNDKVGLGTASPAEKLDVVGKIKLSDNLVIGTSGKGIDFSATSGTGTSELLADYEEGTWTPTVSGSTTAGTGTYNAAVGRYTKVGCVVTAQGYINLASHTGAGNLLLTGLPFTQKNVSDLYGGISIGYLNNLALTALNIATGFGVFNTASISVMQYPVGGGATTEVPLDTAFTIMYSHTYLAD